MDRLDIERTGGLAGFGGPSAKIRSTGTLDLQRLSPSDRQAIEALFAGQSDSSSKSPDGFLYHLSRTTPGGTRTVVVSEERVPDAVRDAVHDELK